VPIGTLIMATARDTLKLEAENFRYMKRDHLETQALYSGNSSLMHRNRRAKVVKNTSG